MHDNMSIGPAGFQQPLHAGNDLLIDVFAGEGIAGTGPGVGEIYAHESGLFAEAYASLKASLTINPCALVECLLKNLVEIVDRHGYSLTRNRSSRSKQPIASRCCIQYGGDGIRA